MKMDLKIKTISFNTRLKNIERNIHLKLVKWSQKSTKRIQIATIPFVPLDEGYLERGWFDKEFNNVNKIYVEFGFSARNNPKTNYDYAWIQHQVRFNHPKRGTDHYLDIGMKLTEKIIFNDLKKELDQIMRE